MNCVRVEKFQNWIKLAAILVLGGGGLHQVLRHVFNVTLGQFQVRVQLVVLYVWLGLTHLHHEITVPNVQQEHTTDQRVHFLLQFVKFVGLEHIRWRDQVHALHVDMELGQLVELVHVPIALLGATL